MLFPDIKDEQFEEFLRALKYQREEKVKLKSPSPRTRELSLPKKKNLDNFDEKIGPGSYNPHDTYLSTKSKSPSIVIGRSNRFYTQKMPKISSSNASVRKVIDNTLNYSGLLSPRFTFKRTGHNLKLVDDIDVPGVGKYSPDMTMKQRAYSFKKSPRIFSWKSNLTKLFPIAQFERRHWK